MRIYLRPINEKDGTQIVKWRNSQSVRSHCMSKAPITLESHIAFYKANVETGRYKQFIVERVDEEFGVSSYPIATVFLKDIDNYNKRCELCIFTSDDQEWNTESQSIAIMQLLDKAFNEYGMHKVYTFVFADNEDEVSLMERSGLLKEAILSKEAINHRGEYVDVIRMAIIPENYK